MGSATQKSSIDDKLNNLFGNKDKSEKDTDFTFTKRKKITGYPKLDDANHAGTNRGHECTLILTEGDSAKSL